MTVLNEGSGHGTKYGIVTTDARPMLIVILLSVTHFIEFRLREGGGGTKGNERDGRGLKRRSCAANQYSLTIQIQLTYG